MDDDDNDDNLAPMVDALTGAMSAILLVSIFMMVSSMQNISSALKEYGKEALYKSESLVSDVFEREPPTLDVKNNRLVFYKTYKLSTEQITELEKLFSQKRPSKITVYSSSQDEMLTYHVLQFLKETGLQQHIDSIQLDFQPARDPKLTEFVWE